MENQKKSVMEYIDRSFPFFAIALVPIFIGFAPYFIAIAQLGNKLSLSYGTKGLLVKIFLGISTVWLLAFASGIFSKTRPPFLFIDTLKNRPVLAQIVRILCTLFIATMIYFSLTHLGTLYSFDPAVDHAW